MRTHNEETLPQWLMDAAEKNAKQSGTMVSWTKTKIATSEGARATDPWAQLGGRFSGEDIEPEMRSFQSVLNRPLTDTDPDLVALEASLNQEKRRLRGMSSYGRDGLDAKADTRAKIIAFWRKHGIDLK